MKRIVLLLTLLITPLAYAVSPPSVEKEIKAQPGFIVVPYKVDGGLGLEIIDPGLSIVPPEFLNENAPGLLLVAMKPGRYRILMWAAKDSESSKAVWVTVIVGDPGPEPPDPGPGPGPGPTPVPDELGLIKASKEGKAKVTNVKPGDAAKLAEAQRSLSSAIAAGALTEPSKILAEWRTKNNASVDSATWAPWGLSVTAALESAYKSGKLPTKDEWRDAFLDIAKGLE